MSNPLQHVEPVPGEAENMQSQHDEMLHRIGLMTRNLHESLRGLGFDKLLEQAAHGIPDARDRLNYVARMTEQAAERVLNATDIATPLQDELNQQAVSLEERWKNILAVPSLKKDYDQVADETMAFLTKTVSHTDATKAQLLDIMMAQDFQDLTGQVIKKITELAQEIEQQLVQVLIDFSPGTGVKKEDNSLMNGPQINPDTAIDVVANQEQVDDLLDSLGF
ncbi:protein phosphatase CheZ [Methylobacillus sp. Pita2]|uniref:protein phosphatase CheZ n=1 Tax=Methylobacillus sp. Pita2 TaxID=3383245 RepID=UPI0038B443AF